MFKTALLIAAGTAALAATPAEARHHHRHYRHYYSYYSPYPYYPTYSYAYPAYSYAYPAYSYSYPAYGVYDGYYAPDPAVYVEPSRPAAPTYAPSAPGGVTWFYCTQPAGYYPYVQSCSKPWVRVVPDATQPPPASTY